MTSPKFHPYPGLRAFERSEARLFFGRQQQVFDILARLKNHKFLAVLGSSGSGKSSLMKAGVLPSLARGYMGDIGARWSIAELKPGDQPFVRLADALLDDPLFRQAWNPSGNRAAPSLTAELRAGWRSLHEILAHNPLPDGCKLLLLVDQFEELFRFRKQEENQASAFVALLLEACTHPDIYVAITMRSDFLGAAAEFPQLPERINDGLYLTPRLSRDQLREAIRTPALQFDGDVEDSLVNHLLNEAANDPDQLPLLQHALMRLWENSADGNLKFADFEGMNGLKGALDGHAELAFAELNATQQRIAEIIFRALTERASDGQDIRRPVDAGQLCAMAACDWPQLTAVVEVFRQAGRNFLMPPPSVELTEDSVLDISHESLIRQWVRLQGWVKAEADSALMYTRLRDAAQRHAANQGECWHGTDLALALEWQTQVQPTAAWAARYQKAAAKDDPAEESFAQAMAFLAESQRAEAQRLAEAEVRRKARMRWLAAALGGALLLSGWAIWERYQTNLARVELIGFTLHNLIANQQNIGSFMQGAQELGQQAVLLQRVAELLTQNPLLSASDKQHWQAQLPGLSPLHLMALIRLLEDPKTPAATFALLAQEVARPRPVVSRTTPQMVKIPAGEFIMGCQDGRDSDCEDDEKPAHRVQIAAFEIGQYEVTQAQWQAVMGDNPSYFQKCGEDCPVELVSWDMIQAFIQKLNAKTGLHYRLPSEAEWEYACRAGQSSAYCGGNAVSALAWHRDNADRQPQAVGRKQANAFGLYDMSGNVWEWVEDTPNSYQNTSADGKAFEDARATARVLRGGSWGYNPQYGRAADRGSNSPTSRYYSAGFRLARTLP